VQNGHNLKVSLKVNQDDIWVLFQLTFTFWDLQTGYGKIHTSISGFSQKPREVFPKTQFLIGYLRFFWRTRLVDGQIF
jgi:hypothetical protein